MSAHAGGTSRDYSRGSGPGEDGSDVVGGASGPGDGVADPRPAAAARAFAAVAALGAAALILADLTTLYSVSVAGVSGRSVTGHHQHGWALALAGVLGLWLAWSALGGLRLAMLGVAVVGILALGIAVLADLPDVHATGIYGAIYANAQASPGAGFYLETAGAALLLLAGGGLLIYER